MGEIAYTEGVGIPHKTFDDEFLTHKKCSEWWYCTGYLQGGDSSMFGYQFTLAKIRILGVKFHLLICSITDLQTNKHYNTQTPVFFGNGVVTKANVLRLGNKAVFNFSPNEHSSKGRMNLHMESGEFCLDVELNAIKPPVWHCDDGALAMGIQNDPKERTYYYSFTNLASTGNLSIMGKQYKSLEGKAWFDRQGGTFTLTDPKCSWEWFSLRFFDDTEAMLFAFPQHGYYDGTRINADGSYHRMSQSPHS
ncbi:MAG: carotenoid 1,2-hydratase [Clostridiales bacterium]|jgi:predicted secreted hydrolase|nr:carotenoid 1,2-hydratase [Clostridiales bacterium]